MANIFSRSANTAPLKIILCVGILAAVVIMGVTYYFTPKYARVGYQPTQPVSFSHAIHVEQLGLDCRYCHQHVDESEHSNVPTANTCMNCHTMVLANDPRLQLVKESYETADGPQPGQPVQPTTSGQTIPWVRIHRTPDYVYFNHAVHVNRGISCIECHGRVDQMEVVWHDKSHSMAFCLECHRNPEDYIRPIDEVYNLAWTRPENSEAVAEIEGFVHDWNVNPPQSCSGCHR
ncbi:MAG: cytochrome c3 family protein [Verrucomicrobiota bacterium]